MTRPAGITERDYLPDEGLVAIEELVAKVPQQFEFANVNASAKAIQVTMRFERAGDVMARLDQPRLLAEAAMCSDTLAKNLRAERAARTELLQLLHRIALAARDPDRDHVDRCVEVDRLAGSLR